MHFREVVDRATNFWLERDREVLQSEEFQAYSVRILPNLLAF